MNFDYSSDDDDDERDLPPASLGAAHYSGASAAAAAAASMRATRPTRVRSLSQASSSRGCSAPTKATEAPTAAAMEPTNGDPAPCPFYGCYLLRSLNPKYKNITYIGFTVNPGRRYKQHNSGKEKGGAVFTDRRKPWQLVLCVYGFMDKYSALRFEWAWQHPERTRFLKTLGHKSSMYLTPRLRVLLDLLAAPAFARTPLCVHWVNMQAMKLLNNMPRGLPSNVSTRFGVIRMSTPAGRLVDLDFLDGTVTTTPVLAADTASSAQLGSSLHPQECSVCRVCITHHDKGAVLRCSHCQAPAHTTCLARVFLQQENETSSDGAVRHLLPVSGVCPRCQSSLLWVSLVRAALALQQDSANSNFCETAENVLTSSALNAATFDFPEDYVTFNGVEDAASDASREGLFESFDETSRGSFCGGEYIASTTMASAGVETWLVDDYDDNQEAASVRDFTSDAECIEF
ncbi:hypothetical protein CAOG_01996 [Capsaspora owczarzaki ATCC 30864]|uniref:Structure-specific endonuclease subunit SLX1 homolog n=1 Tax=Capsaspora owczarzaki (strain ATCC 30864) TaxID=595528 RepID=A0A0D2WLI8_CAPO3|nr:hypothetical protein CAOG_01996 [Capsaspora owczarzaki ATCC 30864]KJE90738.1 hypothetical protein CAOG_001996 [Capsaspora owczarzaki ATCC 30864]|eukprot:XP_004364864.2 hypothetical protein CAOG_01996 [Capsaspora owczarzaki ATCC 30864]